MLDSVSEFLKAKDVEYKEKLRMDRISPIKIGGPAALVVLPENIEQFLEVVRFLSGNKMVFKIVGGMSNILPDDDGYDGILVKTDHLREVTVDGCEISAECGTSLYRLAMLACECGLSGFEELCGIPGRVGGAVYMNAGAYGREVSDLFEECTVFDINTSQILIFKPQDLAFAYRKSRLRDENILLISAKFRLSQALSRDILEKINGYKLKRRMTQPTEMPSLGSVFKRPSPKLSAGELIDRCGLRGFSMGGAAISEKHAGFIVNVGGACSHDVKKLISFAEASVYDAFGVRLQREIEFLSNGR